MDRIKSLSTFFLVLLSLLPSLPGLLFADILLKSPEDGSVVSTIAPEMQAYLNLSSEERWRTFNIDEQRAALKAFHDPVPQSFTWEVTGEECGPYTVEISEQEDFSDLSPVFISSLKGQKNSWGVKVSNFLLGRKYYWRVKGQRDGTVVYSSVRNFKSDSRAPRAMLIPELGNTRDLGGWRTEEGRRVRQGMIYRSPGLNENSPERRNKNGDPKSFAIGRNRITEGGVAYVNEVLKWKTDLDLRSDAEVGAMKESPAGPGVSWVHNSASAYEGIFKNSGKLAMARGFKLFADEKNYPIVFHCIAGSSRTGSLAVVLNGLLGVSVDDLSKDWTITMSAGSTYDNRWRPLIKGFDDYGDEKMRFSEKVERYLIDIGVTREEIAAFRRIMLED